MNPPRHAPYTAGVLREKFSRVGYLGLSKSERTAFKKFTGYKFRIRHARAFTLQYLQAKFVKLGYTGLTLNERDAYRRFTGYNHLRDGGWQTEPVPEPVHFNTLGDTTTPMRTLRDAITSQSAEALDMAEQYTGDRTVPIFPPLRLVEVA